MSKECLRTGDKALIHFRFIKHPEYMVSGQRMVFREGRTKAVGNIVRIILHSTPTAPGNRVKPNKQQRYANQNSPKITAPMNSQTSQGLQEVNFNLFRSNVNCLPYVQSDIMLCCRTFVYIGIFYFK